MNIGDKMKKIQMMISILLIVSISGLFAQTSTPPANGNGTQSNPWQIVTLDNLYWLSQTPGEWVADKYFIQTADIDASTTSTWDVGDHDGDGGTADVAMGFSPIGNAGVRFFGIYNGQDFTIDALFINRPSTEYIGLFGYISSSEISHVGIINAIITGHSRVGALVGFIVQSSIVCNSYSTGAVNGTNSFVGGLVGNTLYQSTVNNSYSAAAVSSNGNAIGGLVGANNSSSTISNSYSTGAVTGNDYPYNSNGVGGLVGDHFNGSIVSYSYSTGAVTGNGNGVGGLVGSNYFSNVSNSFWDTETSFQSSSAGGTGKTSAEMKAVATFTDITTNGLDTAWDFVNDPYNDSGTNDYWTIDEGVSYPNFYNFYVASVCGNNILEPGEICDDGNTLTETECAYGDQNCIACNADCSAELSLTGAYCGDGNLDPGEGEECDDGNQTLGDGCENCLIVTTISTVIYVDIDVVVGGANDGSTWVDAYQFLQDALTGWSAGDEIWVANGEYYPDEGATVTNDDVAASFNLVEGMIIYGGFAGGEALLVDRNWFVNKAILSGDIDADGTGGDTNTDGNNIAETTGDIQGSNSYHIVTANGNDGHINISCATKLDGFYITAGSGQGNWSGGGGLLCLGHGLGNESSPSISNCSFSGNYAYWRGGAIYNDTDFGISSPSLTNCSFSGNSAGSGGAIFNNGFDDGTSSPSLFNCSFTGNYAPDHGGAVYNMGYDGVSSPSLVNCSFSGNSAGFGGAFFNAAVGGGTSSPSLTNCILWGNTAAYSEIYNSNAAPIISYCIVQGGIGATACHEACIDGYNNIYSNPTFVDVPIGDLRLLIGSPAIDAGDNSANSEFFDLAGNARIQNYIIDMGAYEGGVATLGCIDNIDCDDGDPCTDDVCNLGQCENIFNPGICDCNGDLGGIAYFDDCGICVDGLTGLVPNVDQGGGFIVGPDADCAGDCFGTASMDGCGVCVGGNTGLTPCFDMVNVPAGDYTYGEFDVIQNIDYDYEIMKYEVTNAEYVAYLEEALAIGNITVTSNSVNGDYPGDPVWPAGNYEYYDLDGIVGNFNVGIIGWNGSNFEIPIGYENHPVVLVTWIGAYSFAEHYGMRLPTEFEWEKAARGITGADYSWGENFGDYIYDNTNINSSFDPFSEGTTPVGFYNGQNYLGFQTTDSPSPYGAYDMSGNVWEWVDTWILPSWPSIMIRGGSWYGDDESCQTWFQGSAGYLTQSHLHYGFRCASDLSSPQCIDNIDCDDGDPCTDDVCNLGQCENVFNPGICDCNSDLGGSAYFGECGCVEGNTGLTSDWCYGCTDPNACNFDPLAMIDDGYCGYIIDCMGIDCGAAYFDDCQVCSEGTSGHVANSDKDCAGVCFGSAWIDVCGDCVGGTTGLMPCSDVISLDLIDINSSNQTFGIWMNNQSSVNGFQFQIAGSSEIIEIVEAFGGLAEDAGFEVYVGPNNSIIGFSLSGASIPTGDGLLTTLQFAGCDDTELCIINTEITGFEDGDPIILPVNIGECTNLELLLGDVDSNGYVNVIDLVQIVGIIFEEIEPSECQFSAANVFEDGIISVTDIVAVVQIILGGSLTKGNALENAELYNGDERLKVVAVGDIAGMQFEVNGDFGITQHFLPAGWEMSRSDQTILMFSTDGTPLIDEVLLEYSGELTITSNIIVDWHGNSITATISSIIPTDYVLLSAYPNPFNPVTAISFELPEAAFVSLKVYDMNGREIAELVNSELNGGYYTFSWNAIGQSSGIYFVRMITADFTSSQKLMLIK
jgi:cysteine-rich repeat protein